MMMMTGVHSRMASRKVGSGQRTNNAPGATHPITHQNSSATTHAHSPSAISLVAINIQHLSNVIKHTEIETFILSHSPTMLAITETWISRNPANYSKYGYVTYDLSPPSTPSQSVSLPTQQSVLIKKSTPHQILTTHCYIDTYLSMQWFKLRTDIHGSTKYTLVCSVYRSPNAPPQHWDILSNNVSAVMAAQPHSGLLMLGDLNSRLRSAGDIGQSAYGLTHPIYPSLVHKHSLDILNTFLAYGCPTHSYSLGTGHGRGTSITDLALCNGTTLPSVESMTVLDHSLFSSDHMAVSVRLSVPAPFTIPVGTAPHARFNMAKFDAAQFSATMDSTAAVLLTDFDSHLRLGTQASLDAALSHIHTCYSVSAAVSCPKTVVRPGHKPWWNLIPNRDTLYHAYQRARFLKLHSSRRHSSVSISQDYHAAKQQWADAIRVGKDLVYRAFVAQLDSNPTTPTDAHPVLDTEQVSRISLKRRLWWSFYKRTKPSEFGAAMVSNSVGDLPVDQQESLNNLATAFAGISQARPDTTAFQRSVSSDIDQMESEARRDTTTPLPFDRAKMDFIFAKIPKSAAGPDDIHSDFMHATPPSVRAMVFALYTRIWETGILPSGFTQAKVVPLYKGDGSRADSDNYRPISVTSLLVRTMERLLRPMYNSHILPLVHHFQAGFRPGYSTLDNIHRVVDYIYTVLRDRSVSAMLSMDLSKAFDTVWVPGLLHTLWHQFGVRGRAWMFIKAFLSNRTMFVVGQNMQSTLMQLAAGVPQGSVLAPLLFLAFINSLANTVWSSGKGTMALYADDAIAWPVEHKQGTAFDNVLDIAETIREWCDKWKLTINAKKSKCMVITNSKRYRYTRWSKMVMSGGTVIRTVRSLKVLGIKVQGNGKWDTQSHQLLARASSLSHSISKLCVRDGPPQPVSIATVTRAVLLSTIMYGFCLWRPTDTVMHRLQALLSIPLKRALVHNTRSVSTLGALAEFGLPPLHLLRQTQLLLFIHRLFTKCDYGIHLSSMIACTQRRAYLRSKTALPRSAYSYPLYVEAELTAASLLPLSVCAPTQWLPTVITEAVRCASERYLQLSTTGRKAQALCHPYSDKLFQPQYYLSHELKPASMARARLRLDVALTPAVLHRYMPSVSPRCPHCDHHYADRTHLLIHCPHFAEQRAPLNIALRWRHLISLTVNVILGDYSTIPEEHRLNLLTLSQSLILAVNNTLPTTLFAYKNVMLSNVNTGT